MKVDFDVPDDMVRSMLCNAFEGGSSWVQVREYRLRPGITMADVREGGSLQDPKNYWHPCQLVPLLEGCAIVAADTYQDQPPVILDREAMHRGLRIMAEKYPRHFLDMVCENDDAATGDVFLQCCMFGEVVYG
jgi:hypothetical protein